MKKMYIFLICAVVLLLALGLEQCTVHTSFGAGTPCTADNPGAVMCAGNYIQTCGLVNDAPAWVTGSNCADSGTRCSNGTCVSGCNVFGTLYAEGYKECANSTTLGKCLNSQVVYEDCSATGKTCNAATGQCGTPSNEEFSLNLNYGDEIGDVKQTLTESDLPNLLATGNYIYDGTSEPATSTQILHFMDTATGTLLGAGQFVFAADDDGDKIAANYLAFDSDSVDYAYKYEFRVLAYYKLAYYNGTPSLVGTKFTMLGKEYTITSINAAFDSMEITDGQNTYKFQNNLEVLKNGIKISGSNCLIKTSDGTKWNGLLITYTPLDDEYIPEAEYWSDPIFGAINIKFDRIITGEQAIIQIFSYDAGTSYPQLNYSYAVLNFVDSNGASGTVEFRIVDGAVEDRLSEQAVTTKYGLVIEVNGSIIKLKENGLVEPDKNPRVTITLSPTENNTIQINAPVITAEQGEWYASGVTSSRLDRYTKYYATSWGTLVKYDSANKNFIDIFYPSQKKHAQILIG